MCDDERAALYALLERLFADDGGYLRIVGGSHWERRDDASWLYNGRVTGGGAQPLPLGYVLRPPARPSCTYGAFPHKCPRCAKTAYVGFLQVAHQDNSLDKVCR